ncbi:E3 ubiquitin-protein ligase rbbp6 [Podila minutissima]|nr:E3 ubiquitin-protein ligase rbbp6 [Podila minutissima]
MSQIHYKFKSSKDYDSATFDGHSISVFDLKREILLAKGLKGPDDLALTHAESGEEYYDDATLIPKNTPILVARVPAKPGRGGAQRYLEGSGPVRGGGMTRNVFDRPGQSSNTGSGSNSYDATGSKFYKNTAPPQPEQGPTPPVDTSKLSEEEAMKLVFQQEATHWGKTQEGMATATYRPLGKFQSPTRPPLAGGQKPGSGPSGAPGVPGTHPSPYHNRPAMDQQQRPPPNTYVCYRCGKKGEHWIQFCPTNSDKSFEPIGIKKTTGIPKSFLKTVESDVLQSKKGVMVTQDGNLVVAQTNDSAWKKFHEKSRGALTSEEAYATAPVPDDMRCPICRMLLKSAVQAPCCGTNFCDECIRTYLVSPPKGEDPFKCQHCHKALVPDQLMPNHDLRQRVDLHLRDWAKGRLDPDIAAGMHGRHSRGGTPNLGDERQDTRARQGSPFTTKPSNETTGSAESGTKRRASNDHDAPLNGDHDRDGWKNKKQHTNVASNSNFSRSRPNAGPGGMVDGSAMLPDGMPPGFFVKMTTTFQLGLRQVQIHVRDHARRLLRHWQIGLGTDPLANPGAKGSRAIFVTVAIPEILVKAGTDTEAVIVTATGRETRLATEMAKESKDTAVTGKDSTAAIPAVTVALNSRHSARGTMTARDHRAMTAIMIDLLGIATVIVIETETLIANLKERVATRDTNPEETTEGMTRKTTSVIPLPHVPTRTDPAAITVDLIDKTGALINIIDAEVVTIEMRTLMETGPPDIQLRILSPLPDSDHWTLSGSMS